MNKKRDDNRVTNLEWVTSSQNGLHRARFGLYKNYGKRIKDGAKLTRLDVIDIKYYIIKGLTNSELAKKYKVTQSTISKIRNGQSWTNVLI
jgi:DNA-binding MarR family transcriptional regulator